MAHGGEDRLEGFFAPGEFRLEGQFVPGGESRMRLVPAPYGLSTSGAVFLRRTTARLGSGAEQNTPSFRMLHPPNTSTHPPDGPTPPLHTPYPPSDLSTSAPGSQQVMCPVPSGGTHHTPREPCETRRIELATLTGGGDVACARARHDAAASLSQTGRRAPTSRRCSHGTEQERQRSTSATITTQPTHTITTIYNGDVVAGVLEYID